METAQWNTGCAYVRGRSHIKEDVPCQDRAMGLKRDGVTLIALADGAGSAKQSHIGAELAIEVLAELIMGSMEQDEELVEGTAAEWLNKILLRLGEAAEAEGLLASDYASTLLFAAVKGDRYAAGHLGDGLIAVERGESLEVFSHPENGEYANSTYFTTSRDAAAHFRIYTGNVEDIKAFFLMSDGTAATMHRRSDDTLAPALKSISGWFEEHTKETIEQALHQNLEQVIKNKTFDDCSIAVMRKI